jgi:nucleotide-binding universal stress UspA family protein
MLPIHTILHPTDFSERSVNAFHLACGLARDYGARLVVLHVAVPPTVIYGEGILPPNPELQLQEEQRQLDSLQTPQPGVRAERRLEEGDPATEILRVAQEIGANIIVMGTHGRTGLTRLLMGSVAERVVRKASCPVMTVTTPFPNAEPAPAMAAVEEVAVA